MNWLWAGGIVATLSAGWGYIRSIYAYLASLLVVQVIVEYDIVNAVLVYLQDNCRTLRIGPQTYIGHYTHVKSVGRTQLVAWRILGRLGALYFEGQKPLWISRGKRDEDSRNADFVSTTPYVLKINFIRGMFDADSFVFKAVSYYNEIRDNTLSIEQKRHYIRRIYGLSKKRAFMRSDDEMGQPEAGSVSKDDFEYRGGTPIGYKRENIGIDTGRMGLETLALSPMVEEAILEARRWKKSEQWYKDRGLSWHRGWLLYGHVGTGKTALTRALAEEMDLPVYIYDLASLANDEFQSAWRGMLSSVPCIALIEDIDNIFEGRKTIVGDLTFDCFLNCLDGIERTDGLFTIITTNNPDKLDIALGIANGEGRSTRPGRVDRAILMDSPNKNGRLRIAKRILAEYPYLWEEIVNQGDRETGAQFQERCASLALKLYWDRKE